MILNTVLDITREARFELVSVKSISGRLQCPIQPILTCYGSTDELKRELLNYAYELCSQYVEDFNGSENINPYLVLPVSYIEFAREETHLPRLLFINHMGLSMKEPKDLYKGADNERREKIFSDVIGIEPELAKIVFVDLLLYSRGTVVLTAAQKIILDRNHIGKMAASTLTVLIRQEEPDQALSLQRYVRINKNIRVQYENKSTHH